MEIKMKNLLLSIVVLFILSSCGGISCDSSDTKDLVLEIIDEEMAKQIGKESSAKLSYKLKTIQTTKENNSVHTCKANLEISGNGRKNTIPLTYTAEDNNDGTFEVIVYDL
jgi:hypothetical protein